VVNAESSAIVRMTPPPFPFSTGLAHRVIVSEAKDLGEWGFQTEATAQGILGQ
jgi:hypothetical protein